MAFSSSLVAFVTLLVELSLSSDNLITHSLKTCIKNFNSISWGKISYKLIQQNPNASIFARVSSRMLKKAYSSQQSILDYDSILEPTLRPFLNELKVIEVKYVTRGYLKNSITDWGSFLPMLLNLRANYSHLEDKYFRMMALVKAGIQSSFN